jgi:hypothetical protein
MDIDDTIRRANNLRQLEQLEEKPVAPYDPTEGMDNDSVRQYARFLYESLQEMKSLYEEEKRLRREEGEKNSKEISRLTSMIEQLMKQIADLTNSLKSLEDINAGLSDQLRVQLEHRFGSRSQRKKKETKKQEEKNQKEQPQEPDREEEKEDFDGTNAERPKEDETMEEETAKKHKSGVDSNRTGRKYDTMTADEKVLHPADLSLIPEGCVYVFTKRFSTFEEEVKYVEHIYELVCYRDANGKLYTEYLPKKDDPNYRPYIDRFPNTHASANLLANIVYNKYVMEVPYYRAMLQVVEQRMHMSRQTLMNWAHKPEQYLLKIVEQLKKQALKAGAVINGDETWQRLVLEVKRKVYVWCLVNTEEKIVLFFYDNGSRSRASLQAFLGNAKIDALQSDGFNVYMYLDDEVLDTDHLCCMAHARAKFYYALTQGKDARANKMLDYIGQLYGLEDYYKRQHLKPEQIKEERQKEKTLKIKEAMKVELQKLREGFYGQTVGLMEKAINYMTTFWNQLFMYLKDGRYTIDNLAAERAIRPLTIERKNSNSFCSHAGVQMSALYHTIIATCRMQGYSVLEYLKTFFTCIIQGRRDYENLMPATIGISKMIKNK